MDICATQGNTRSVSTFRYRLDHGRRRGTSCLSRREPEHRDYTQCHMNEYIHCHRRNVSLLFGLGIPQRRPGTLWGL